MSFLRAFYLAAAAGIGGYLHESILNKWLISHIHSRNELNNINNYLKTPPRPNDNFHCLTTATKRWQNNYFFKVNAQAKDPSNEEPDKVTNDNPKADIPNQDIVEPEIAGAKKLKIGCEIQVFADPIICSRNIITFQNDWAIHCDSRTRTPFWTVENIMNCNVHQVEHRHCEAFRVSFSIPVGFKYGHPDNKKRLDANNVYVPVVHPASTEEGSKETCTQEFICDYCQYSNFWGVFHQYISFLTCMYDYVQVCSGLLYLSQEETEECSGLSEEQLNPSHFFKVILCRNSDGSYRFECYKIPNEPLNDEEHNCINLSKYLVSRDDLERDGGFCIFPHVPRYSMRQANTHPQFVPNNCSI